MVTAFASLLALSILYPVLGADPAGYQCKCAPTESCWPTASQWAELNTAVEGTLQRVVPPGAVCYASGFEGASTFDQAACDKVTGNWTNEQYITDQPASNLWPLSTNNTCDPPAVRTSGSPDTCTIGFLPRYVILATKPAHVQAGILFAKKYNIRLIIRNTGHDFMGRSTGWGSLAINTHSFKDMQWLSKYDGPSEDNWTGSAVKLGSGIQTRELYKKAFAQDPKVVVVGGECPTVGITGGYIQGGGHGPMATLHGMGADNVLSFDVVTANGTFLTANSKENADLYWALRGGGPGTFAVVLSATLKTFPEIKSAAATLDITTTNMTLFFGAITSFHKRANDYVDKGMFVYYEIFVGRFHVHPWFAPGMTKAELDTFLKPFFTELDAIGVPYNASSSEWPTFFELYTGVFEDEQPAQSAITGGRILTREDIANNHSAIMSAYQAVLQPPGLEPTGGGIIGHIVGPGKGKPSINNAIHPVWRNASSFSITTLPSSSSFADKARVKNLVTNVIGKAFREAAPHGGSYVNEGDLEEPDWQTSYWGTNYPRLKELKKKWDPEGLFYSQTTPGTEDWEVIEYGTKLCKKLSALSSERL